MGRLAPLEDMAVRSDYEVIGFEPSWMIKNGNFEDYYFNLLSTLVIGEYDINPTTGAARNQESFRLHLEKKIRNKDAKKELNIIETADFINPKMSFLLQLTYYGDYGRESRQRVYVPQLIKDVEVHQSLTDSLKNYFLELSNNHLIDNDRSGILLDFQIDVNYYNEDFVDFVKYLRNELGEDHKIYMKIPAKVRKDALIPFNVIQNLEPYIDRFIVQGYGFEKYTKPEEYSPLVIMDPNSSYSIDGTLRNYMIPGYERVIQNKFIVELPYYGVKFRKDFNKNYLLDEGSPYITIDDFNRNVKGRSGSLKYNENQTMAYFVEGDSLAYLVEDSISLVTKYFYLTDSLGMNGFALNAIGYYTDQKRRGEGWAAIADNFGEKREKLGWVIAYYLTAFIPIGFVFSLLRYWEVRNALAKFGTYWNRFRLFFLLFVLIFLVCSGILPRYILVIVGLIIMAFFIAYIMIKKILMRSKRYTNLVK